MDYTVEMHRTGDEPIPFLDASVRLDPTNGHIRTAVHYKPGNARELTRADSNCPRHVLKSIICGMLKRYVIISDTKCTFLKEKKELSEILIRQGWPRAEIRNVRGIPKYGQRAEFIRTYMENQRQKRAEWIRDHTDEDMHNATMAYLTKQTKYDDDIVVGVGPRYNAVFDDGQKIKTLVQKARERTLPGTLQTQELIIAFRGERKAAAYFKSNGL